MRQILFHKSFPQCCGKSTNRHFYTEKADCFFALLLGQTLILRENMLFSVEKCSGKVDNLTKSWLWKTLTYILPCVQVENFFLTKSLCKSSKVMV